jgi:hypothetical protein
VTAQESRALVDLMPSCPGGLDKGGCPVVSLLRVKHTAIPSARAKLAAALPSTTEILRGSLLHRRIRHRTGCAVCARGPGHLVWVLTVSYPGGRTKQISLSAEQKPMVQQWLRNYRKLKATLERICELNQQLLRPEKKA